MQESPTHVKRCAKLRDYLFHSVCSYESGQSREADPASSFRRSSDRNLTSRPLGNWGFRRETPTASQPAERNFSIDRGNPHKAACTRDHTLIFF